MDRNWEVLTFSLKRVESKYCIRLQKDKLYLARASMIRRTFLTTNGMAIKIIEA
jgi:hypothetical protein